MSSVRQGNWQFYFAKGERDVALVLVHEIFGHSPYMESVARDLSANGISAASIDLYGGRKAATMEEASELRTSVTRESLLEGISAGIQLLENQTEARKIGTMGFCMGGGFALQAACSLRLGFCVDYYGAIENVDDVTGLQGPVLLVLGGEDARVTPWAFDKFLPAAAKHKKRVEAQLYPNAKHAFHRPGWEGHNPDAAKDAWEKTLRFLSDL